MNYFEKIAAIFASQDALLVSTTLVSMTPAANFATSSAGIVDTDGNTKFATCVNETGGNDVGNKLTPVSMAPVAN